MFLNSKPCNLFPALSRSSQLSLSCAGKARSWSEAYPEFSSQLWLTLRIQNSSTSESQVLAIFTEFRLVTKC